MNMGRAAAVGLVVVVCWSRTLTGTERGEALSLERVRELVRVPAPDAAVAGEIATRGVLFEPDLTTIGALQKLGAGPETVASLRSLRAVIDGAEGRLPKLLERIYGELAQGNVRSLADMIAPSLLADYARLDAICEPGTYRAHLVERTAARGGGVFEVFVRVLRQPVSERAEKLIFRALPAGLQLEDVDVSEAMLGGWFRPQLTAAPEVVRRLVWAARKGDGDVVAASFSHGLDGGRLFSGRLARAWKFESVQLGPAELVDLAGLKVRVKVSTDAGGPQGYFVVAGDPPRVVAWGWSAEMWDRVVEDRDRGIEEATLVRFGLASAPAASGAGAQERSATPPEAAAIPILLKAGVAALARGESDQARAKFDEVLSRSGEVPFPVAREKALGLDLWRLVLRSDSVGLVDLNGVAVARATAREVVVERVGTAHRSDRYSGIASASYVRLKLQGKSYNLYYRPEGLRCWDVQRELALGAFLQCEEPGPEQQQFVAEYVATRLARR